jgi:hypothetical protein
MYLEIEGSEHIRNLQRFMESLEQQPYKERVGVRAKD